MVQKHVWVWYQLNCGIHQVNSVYQYVLGTSPEFCFLLLYPADSLNTCRLRGQFCFISFVQLQT